MRTGLLESPVLLVAGGGAVGAGLRWAVLGALPDGNLGGYATTATLASGGDGLPWGLPWPVVLVNLVGCALLGAHPPRERLSAKSADPPRASTGNR